MLKKITFIFSFLSFIVLAGTALALVPKETARWFNGPTVSSISSSTAQISLSPSVLASLAPEEKSNIYFEYYETEQVCIMIYPTPEYCLPKKTEAGKTEATITNLKPNTSYTVTYKSDNTIRCITIPCPTNEFQSLSVKFKTSSEQGVNQSPIITKYLIVGSRGDQVTALQSLLKQQGYLQVAPTGYYGKLTYKAIQKFQSSHNISQVGVVGPITRGVLAKMLFTTPGSDTVETFEGNVTAYSTSCFSDGECSITVDGKKVVTTIGWSQQIVGQVLGIPDFGSIEKYVGARAKVYAKKTSDGYTLYGSSDYYIKISPLVDSKTF